MTILYHIRSSKYVLKLILLQLPILISEEDRIMEIKRLEETGWRMLTERDALYKELTFQDFNQVHTADLTTYHSLK